MARSANSAAQQPGDLLGSLFAAVDAVGHADTVKGVAREKKAGMPTQPVADTSDLVQMTDIVLRHRGWPAADMRQDRIALNAQQFAQLAGGYLEQSLNRSSPVTLNTRSSPSYSFRSPATISVSGGNSS